MDRNLFRSLAKWKDVPENFCTEALAWLLENDPPARTVFLEACAHGVGKAQGSSAAVDVLERLARCAALQVNTRKTIQPDQRVARYCWPDLHLTDGVEVCCLIEIKQWAKPSYSRSLDPEEVPAHPDRNSVWKRQPGLAVDASRSLKFLPKETIPN